MTTLKNKVRTAAGQFRELFPAWGPPTALLQLGTGFEAVDLFDDESIDVPLDALTGIPARTAAGNAPRPRLRLGHCADRQILVLEGHCYLHEGAGVAPCILPALAAAEAGIRNLVLVEAGLTLREDIKAGSWMVLTDYINNQGVIPLAACAELVESVYADMSEAFSQALNAELINAVARVGIVPRLGVYQGNLGPQFDTPAEIEAARRNGADVVGHAIIPETIAGSAAACRVAACVLVAETAPSYRGKKITRHDIADAIQFCAPDIIRGLRCAFREGELFRTKNPASSEPPEIVRD